jgi:hypothetical protein
MAAGDADPPLTVVDLTDAFENAGVPWWYPCV